MLAHPHLSCVHLPGYIPERSKPSAAPVGRKNSCAADLHSLLWLFSYKLFYLFAPHYQHHRTRRLPALQAITSLRQFQSPAMKDGITSSSTPRRGGSTSLTVLMSW